MRYFILTLVLLSSFINIYGQIKVQKVEKQPAKEYFETLRTKQKEYKIRADEIYADLEKERSKKPKSSKEPTSREIELQKSYNEAMDLLSITESALKREKEERKRDQENFEKKLERMVQATEKLANSAKKALEERNDAIHTSKMIISKNQGFKIVNGVILDGTQTKTLTVKELGNGDVTFKNPKIGKKFTHLDYLIEYYVPKSTLTENLIKVEGYIVIYEDNLYSQSLEVPLIRENMDYGSWFLFKSENLSLELKNKIPDNKEYKYAYIQKEKYDNKSDIIEKLSFWEICKNYSELYLFTTEESCEPGA